MPRIYRFVSLDLGTRAGFVQADVILLPTVPTLDALPYSVEILRADFYDLKSALQHGGSVARWRGYRTLLGEITPNADKVFFEDVPEAAHTGAGAARVHGGLRATLELFANDNGLRLQGVSIQAAKRHLAGSGAANKKMMKNAALRRFGVSDPTTSGDVADALGVLLAGVAHEYARLG